MTHPTLPDLDPLDFEANHGCVGCGMRTPNRCPGLLGSCGAKLCTRCGRYDDAGVCGACRREAVTAADATERAEVERLGRAEARVAAKGKQGNQAA